jgi:polyisoprenoid-binding protein YceI
MTGGVFRGAAAWAAALLLAGGGASAVHGDTRQYRILPEESTVRVFAYREGVFSLLAHDHVLLAKDVTGRVTVDTGDIARSTLSIAVGVAGMLVDSPDERKRAGFEGELTEGNRASIQEALLGPDVLNAKASPAVTAAAEQVAGQLPDLTLALRLKIRERERVVTVPAKVTLAADRLTASGKFEFKQSDFGIAPYTALFGAIAVQDRVVVQFDLAAGAQP